MHSREDQLGEVAGRIRSALIQNLKPLERWGLIAYFSFRSQAEQAELKDEAWA